MSVVLGLVQDVPAGCAGVFDAPHGRPAAKKACSNRPLMAAVLIGQSHRLGVSPSSQREESVVGPAPVSKLFEEAEIAARVEALAGKIVRTMGAEFVVIGVLKGSFVFLADLVRALARAGAMPNVEFMRLASYGQKKESSGEVLLLGDVPRDFEGRAVLLVDDIVDTGLSMAYGKRLLTERHASRVRTCALLDKPSRRQADVAIDFVGFEIPDVFVVGYGIDYAEKYRYLPYIGKVG
jgi:hypoxanthine phosphoribosyltransferase